jgi:hypothetical protein
MSEFQDRVQPQVEGLLEPGEQLLGICAATRTSAFKGKLIGLAVTDRRLMLMPLNPKIEADRDVASILPEEIVSSEAEGVSGGWWTPPSPIMDKTAVTLKLRPPTAPSAS